MKPRKSTREWSWTNSNVATQLAGQETLDLEAPSPDNMLRRGKEKTNSRSTQIRQQSTAPRKIFHSAQVVTESKQKSFSHVANTETKNRRRLRNSIGGKTNRRCEKGKVATTQTKTPPNLSMNKNLMGHRQALSAKAKTQKETQI
jgi:hypothetical protein